MGVVFNYQKKKIRTTSFFLSLVVIDNIFFFLPHKEQQLMIAVGNEECITIADFKFPRSVYKNKQFELALFVPGRHIACDNEGFSCQRILEAVKLVE